MQNAKCKLQNDVKTTDEIRMGEIHGTPSAIEDLQFAILHFAISCHAVQSLRWRDEGILSILRYLVTVRRATG